MVVTHDKYLELQWGVLDAIKHGIQDVPQNERLRRLNDYRGFVKYMKSEFLHGKTPKRIRYDDSRPDYGLIVERLQEFEEGVHADKVDLASVTKVADRYVRRLIEIEKEKKK